MRQYVKMKIKTQGFAERKANLTILRPVTHKTVEMGPFVSMFINVIRDRKRIKRSPLNLNLGSSHFFGDKNYVLSVFYYCN